MSTEEIDGVLDSLFTVSGSEEERYPLREFLKLCKGDPRKSENAAARMVRAIGDPIVVPVEDERLRRLYGVTPVRTYPKAFPGLFGLVDEIEQIVDFLRYAADGHEQMLQALCLKGPNGAGKSTLAACLKELFETQPTWVLSHKKENSPYFEGPFGLFSGSPQRRYLIDTCGVPANRFRVRPSSWATQKLSESNGDMSGFEVVRVMPSAINRIGIARFDFATGSMADKSVFIGTPHASGKNERYQPNGLFNRTTQGLLELAEFMKDPSGIMSAFVPATADSRYATAAGEEPYEGIIICHTTLDDFQNRADDSENTTLLARVVPVEIPYITDLTAEVDAYEAKLSGSADRGSSYTRDALEVLALGGLRTRFGDIDAEGSIKRYSGLLDLSNKSGSPRSVRDMKKLDHSNRSKSKEVAHTGCIGVSTRDMLKLLPRAIKSDPDQSGLDPFSAYMFMLRADVLHGKEIDGRLTVDEVNVVVYQRARELVKAYVEQASVEDMEKFGTQRFERYLALLTAWDADTGYNDPDAGDIKPRAWIDSELANIEVGVPIDQRGALRQRIVLFRDRTPTATPAELLERMEKTNNKDRLIFESSGGLIGAKKDTDELKDIISFNGEKDAATRKKHEAFVGRMMAFGYTKRQVRNMVDWHLDGLPQKSVPKKK